MSWERGVPNPAIPPRLQGKCWLYVTWPFASTCKAHCRYCFADPAHTGFVARWWTAEQAISAWEKIRDLYGPTFVLFSGLEPCDELPLMARVLDHHYGAAVTNFTFDEEELYDLVPPNRLDLHPTFHAHLWQLDLDPFLAKVARIRSHGYHIGTVAMVGDPDYLPYWDDWVQRIRQAGLYANCAPMRDTERGGRQYPSGYTEAELEIIRRHVPGFYDSAGRIKPRRIRSCATGVVAVNVHPDGTVCRCIQSGNPKYNMPKLDMGDQNLMRDGQFTLLTEALPCPATACMCGNMYGFHILEGEP